MHPCLPTYLLPITYYLLPATLPFLTLPRLPDLSYSLLVTVLAYPGVARLTSPCRLASFCFDLLRLLLLQQYLLYDFQDHRLGT
jgi:hypothetical protein